MHIDVVYFLDNLYTFLYSVCFLFAVRVLKNELQHFVTLCPSNILSFVLLCCNI